MSRLRKPTQIRRRTVMQNPGRKVVSAEPGVDPSAERHITLILPASPAVHMAMSPYERLEGDISGIDNAGAEGVDIAEGRVFQWPTLDPDHDLCFTIQAGQEITLFAKEGKAFVTVIVEYLSGDA